MILHKKKDETSGEKIEVDDLDLSIRSLHSSGTDSLEGFKDISFTGDTRCKTLKIYRLTLMNLAMSATGEKGILDINPVSMNISGGTGNGSFHKGVPYTARKCTDPSVNRRSRRKASLSQSAVPY